MLSSKSLKRSWIRYEWSIVALTLVFSIALGFWGFAKHFSALRTPVSFWYLLYLSLQLITLESGAVLYPIHWQLEIARIFVPLTAGYTVFRAIFTVLQEQLQWFRLRHFRNHIVICGLGKKGLLLARSFRENEKRIVIIEKDEDNASVESCKQDGMIVLIGDATDKEMLRKASVAKAKCVFAVCDQDGTNAEIAVHTRELAKNSPEFLNCIIHIYEPRLCNHLRKQVILNQSDRLRIEYFNVFDSGAKLLLSQFQVMERAEARLLIVGIGKLGESLVLWAARNWKSKHQSSGKKLPVLIVDRSASHKIESILARYPHLSDVCDLQALQMDVDSAEFQRAGFLKNEQHKISFTNIFVCFDNDSLSLSTGMALHRLIKSDDVDIVVRMNGETGLATMLQGTDSASHEFHRLHAFGLLDRTCNPDLLYQGTRESIARAIHEEYVKTVKKEGHTPDTNPAAVAWDDLRPNLKESNRQQADHIGAKLKAIDCDIEVLTNWNAENFQFQDGDLEKLAILEHDRWMKERESEGFIYAAGPKNLQDKTTPYLVPWEKLPEQIKEYDRNAVRAIPVLLANAGFQIYHKKLNRK